MDTKLAVKRLQYRKLLLCCRTGNRRNGFQNRNDLLLLFAASKKAVKVFRGNGTGTVLGFDRPISLNPSVKGASATEHFQSLYEEYHLDFQATYYDLTKLLDKPLKRGSNTNEQNRVLSSFEDILEGKIVQRDKKFYLKIPGEGEFEMGLVSEGYRKLGTIIYLISSGRLNKNSVLFGDEPETNMNPKMIQPIVNAVASRNTTA